jgi:predicted small metal-binding protein
MRYVMDCRTQPSEANCTLMISGERDEVLRAAVSHAVDAHGHEDTPEFREMLSSALTPEDSKVGA